MFIFRHNHAFFSERIAIKTSEKWLSDAVNNVFEQVAKRFAEDPEHQVFLLQCSNDISLSENLKLICRSNSVL